MHIHAFTIPEFILCVLAISAPSVVVGYLVGKLKARRAFREDLEELHVTGNLPL